MDGTAVLNQRPFLKPALIGLVSRPLIVPLGLLRLITNPEPNPVAPVPATEPSGSLRTPRAAYPAPSPNPTDTDAITALVATTEEGNLPCHSRHEGSRQRRAVKFNGVSTGRPKNADVASAITFESADSPPSAISAIKQGSD